MSRGATATDIRLRDRLLLIRYPFFRLRTLHIRATAEVTPNVPEHYPATSSTVILPLSNMAPIAKPEARMVRPTPMPVHTSEAARVRRIQEAVGGPTALSTLSDPSAVRAAVILALAHEQTVPEEYARIARGDLTASERRIVRTVTNRGAAVRSRLRQRRELHRLRAELRAKDERVRALENALRDAMAAGLVLPGHLQLYPESTPVSSPPAIVPQQTTTTATTASTSDSLLLDHLISSFS